MTLETYLAAPPVAEPLCRYDCVPVVSGANAIVLTSSTHRCAERSPVRIRALRAAYNADHQHGDGLVTGLASIRDSLWCDANLQPTDMNLVSVYDDYPSMIL